MSKSIVSLIILLLCAKMMEAQIDNRLLENNIVLHDSSKESIGLSVCANQFLKNNEYFDSISNGYTLFGSQLNAQLFYIVNPHVKLQAGIYARKDFGNDGLKMIQPVFSVKLQKNGYSLIMGNLEGNISHRLAEPLFNYERFILNHLEQGLQAKIEKRHFWADTWMNWEVQQYLGSDFQEQFTVGHSSKTAVYNHRQLRISLPLQGIISHRGGQIDIDTSALQTVANTAIGVIFSYTNQKKNALIKEWSSENYFSMFNDFSPSKQLPFKSGSGLFLNVRATTKYDLNFSLGYWKGEKFIASRGGDLFQSSASIYGKQGYQEPSRELLFFRALYQHRIFDAMNVDIRFEPYYHIALQKLNYSYSIYLTYKNDLSLLNLKNSKRSGK